MTLKSKTHTQEIRPGSNRGYSVQKPLTSPEPPAESCCGLNYIYHLFRVIVIKHTTWSGGLVGHDISLTLKKHPLRWFRFPLKVPGSSPGRINRFSCFFWFSAFVSFFFFFSFFFLFFFFFFFSLFCSGGFFLASPHRHNGQNYTTGPVVVWWVEPVDELWH
jgi:hypothetical protein